MEETEFVKFELLGRKEEYNYLVEYILKRVSEKTKNSFKEANCEINNLINFRFDEEKINLAIKKIENYQEVLREAYTNLEDCVGILNGVISSLLNDEE